MRNLKLVLMSLILATATAGTLPSAALAEGPSQPESFTTKIDLPFAEDGVHEGAPYRIRVPANWNGTLLVYAHGLNLGQLVPPIRIAPGREGNGSTDVEEDFMSLGYALAGSSYRDDGVGQWAVKEGIQNTLALTNYFNGRVGRPKHVILWGLSMGGIIALESAERFPGVYDGVIAESANGAGAAMTFDPYLLYQVAYDVAFGWPEEWGSVGNIRDDVSFLGDVRPVLNTQLYAPENFGKAEFFRLVLKQPPQLFYANRGWALTMWLVTEFIGDLEERAGGPCLQNLDARAFSMSEADMAYLNSLGMDAQALANQMNARRDVEASVPGRNYIERYATPTGNVRVPVITLHNFFDGMANVSHTRVFRDKVNLAGNGDLLLQAYTDRPGHGVFTRDQYVQTLLAMSEWLDTGERPDSGDYFLPEYGFLQGFVPPPWPFTE